ncbi:hypothetical protein [Hydrogenophaga sp.]|uniref:hypothetical protein n=1 Tax=Hydrogenophaga sp. TaxID=1904254 RepID=UPI00272145FE|nr:hypothetical protein [Hydrogenophaga sp.]MDO9435314.1 hypothetical protein [Hydrogenophaga sp.]
MSVAKRPPDKADQLPPIPAEPSREATRLMKYFKALSPENQSLSVKLLRTLLKMQGPAKPP